MITRPQVISPTSLERIGELESVQNTIGDIRECEYRLVRRLAKERDAFIASLAAVVR